MHSHTCAQPYRPGIAIGLKFNLEADAFEGDLGGIFCAWMRVCAICLFLLVVSIVPFRKHILFPSLQIPANSILPRREKSSQRAI